MTRDTLARWVVLGMALLIGVHAVTLGASRQSATGFMPNWADLETWSRADVSSRQTEVGLGLQLTGSGGTTLVSFSARLDSRAPAGPPADVLVVAAPGVLANPNMVHAPGLLFAADDGTDKRAVVDLNSVVAVDDPTPRAIVHNETARLRTEQFVRLCQAETLRAVVFGSEVRFRPDQIKAMAALAERLHLPIRK